MSNCPPPPPTRAHARCNPMGQSARTDAGPPVPSPASSYTTQTQVYNDLGTDVVNACFEGFNGCVFAYGQTGSGKSYSMMGYGEKGLIPRICEGIFTRSAKLKKEVRETSSLIPSGN